MTIETLSEYYKLSCYLKALRAELERLRSKAYGVSSAIPGLKGMHGGCKSDRVGETAAEIADREEQIRDICRECEAARERIFVYITRDAAKKDPLAASMMYWRFIGRLSWHEVGARTGNTADNCRKTVMRFLERTEKEEQQT